MIMTQNVDAGTDFGYLTGQVAFFARCRYDVSGNQCEQHPSSRRTVGQRNRPQSQSSSSGRPSRGNLAVRRFQRRRGHAQSHDRGHSSGQIYRCLAHAGKPIGIRLIYRLPLAIRRGVRSQWGAPVVKLLITFRILIAYGKENRKLATEAIEPTSYLENLVVDPD
jgi:hypothetical protein